MKRQLISLAIAAVFTLGAPLAMAQTDSAMAASAASTMVPAQNTMQHDNMMKHKRMGKRHHRMLGKHMMPSTVDSVDHETGIVDLTSLGMHLQVHFPPPTISELKAGDKINLSLGYRMQNSAKGDMQKSHMPQKKSNVTH